MYVFITIVPHAVTERVEAQWWSGGSGQAGDGEAVHGGICTY
jgi:hypothetical protein